MNKSKYFGIFIIIIGLFVFLYIVYNNSFPKDGQCIYKSTDYHFKFKYNCNNLSVLPYGWGSTKEINKNYRSFTSSSSKSNYLNQLGFHVYEIDNDRGQCSWKGQTQPPYYTAETLLCYQLLNKNNKQ